MHNERTIPERQASVAHEPSPQAAAIPAKRSPLMVLLRWLPIAVVLVLAVFGAIGVLTSMMPQP